MEDTKRTKKMTIQWYACSFVPGEKPQSIAKWFSQECHQSLISDSFSIRFLCRLGNVWLSVVPDFVILKADPLLPSVAQDPSSWPTLFFSSLQQFLDSNTVRPGPWQTVTQRNADEGKNFIQRLTLLPVGFLWINGIEESGVICVHQLRIKEINEYLVDQRFEDFASYWEKADWAITGRLWQVRSFSGDGHN